MAGNFSTPSISISFNRVNSLSVAFFDNSYMVFFSILAIGCPIEKY